jgi:hypothetical protein
MLISKRLGGIRVGKISFVKSLDIIATCAINITITTELIGNVKGHKFLWEQIVGDTTGVVYDTPLNEPTLSYTNNIPPGTRDDKRFRFWIDRGKSYQQFYDVWVWSSPVTYMISDNTYSVNQSNNATQIGVSGLSIGLAYTYIFDENTVLTYEGYSVVWDQPTSHNLSLFENYQIEEFNATTGNWDVVDITVDTSYNSPLINKAYRVIAKYRNTNTPQLTGLVSNIIYYTDQATPLSVAIRKGEIIPIATSASLNNTNVVSGLTTTQITLQTYIVPNDTITVSAYGSLNNNNIISGLNTTQFTLITYIVPNDNINVSSYSSLNNNNIISNYTVIQNENSNIGG